MLILFYFALQWTSLFTSKFRTLKCKCVLMCTLYRTLKLNVLKQRTRIVFKWWVSRSLLMKSLYQRALTLSISCCICLGVIFEKGSCVCGEVKNHDTLVFFVFWATFSVLKVLCCYLALIHAIVLKAAPICLGKSSTIWVKFWNNNSHSITMFFRLLFRFDIEGSNPWSSKGFCLALGRSRDFSGIHEIKSQVELPWCSTEWA